MEKDDGNQPTRCFCKKGFIHRVIDTLTGSGCHWEITATNGYRLPCEAKCRKGQYAHRILKASDLPEVAEWQEGKHPN